MGGLVVVGRSAELQVVEADEWTRLAARQHQTAADVPAARGAILDRDGVPLAVSRESYEVSVAPRELADPARARALLTRALGISSATARRVTDPADPWHVVPGRFEPAVRAALGSVRGVHLERRITRSYPHGDLARAILGRVQEGKGTGGIEEAYDRVLQGRAGRQVVARDNEGRPIPGEVFVVEAPVPGGEVRLTLDLDLQEIAHEALEWAVDQTEARGGDLLITDPRTGELLALASRKDGRGDALSVINAPYEPGSTMKPFTVAGLLQHGRGDLEDVVDTEGGWWMVGGRPLTDIRDYGEITVAEALRVSSNVGIAKAAAALSPAEQYRTLRNFGFGTPTGLPLPGEVGGTLRHPDEWSDRSSASLAIGYEVSATPIQMAMAYGALANGGTLMEPRLVKSARDRTGVRVEESGPRAVRRVVSHRVTDALRRVLVDVVEEGTGTAARLSSFAVAGKSGTSRVYVPGVGYEQGRYFASFAGYFPAQDPQLVIFVKLDSPEGDSYYGGATAAPVTRATMEAVLAARRAPIDRKALLRVRRAPVDKAASSRGATDVRFASNVVAMEGSSAEPPASLPSRHVDGPAGRPTAGGPDLGVSSVPDGAPGLGVSLPDVSGLSARAAARRLHGLGFRVKWSGGGPVIGSLPPAGTRLSPGDTVTIRSGSSDP